jgi:hypothetical protein
VAQLRNSGAIPLESSTLELSTLENKADSPPADDDAQPSPPKRRRRESGLPLPSALPCSLKALELKDTSVNELAAIEHCLWLLQKEGPPLSEVELIASAESLGLRFLCVMQLIPTSISLQELTDLLQTQVARAMTNVKSTRKALLSAMGDVLGTNFFHPDGNDLVVQWTSDGSRYLSGERLPVINHRKHPANNQRFLTDEAVHCIRHIVFCFKIPITKFPGLWNSFSVLFLRRPLSSDELSSNAILPFRFY